MRLWPYIPFGSITQRGAADLSGSGSRRGRAAAAARSHRPSRSVSRQPRYGRTRLPRSPPPALAPPSRPYGASRTWGAAAAGAGARVGGGPTRGPHRPTPRGAAGRLPAPPPAPTVPPRPHLALPRAAQRRPGRSPAVRSALPSFPPAAPAPAPRLRRARSGSAGGSLERAVPPS